MEKCITVQGTTISFLHEDRSSEYSIVFLHGNSGSAQIWVNQFKAVELKSYNLVAPDLPCHGNSSELPGDAINVVRLSEIMAAFTNEVIQQPYLVVGFSLGSNIAAEMLPHLEKRPLGLILAGPSLVGSAAGFHHVFNEQVDCTVLLQDNLADQQIDSFLQTVLLNSDFSQSIKRDFKRVAEGFKTNLIKSAVAGSYSDEVEIVNSYGLPVALVSGENDRVINRYIEPLIFHKWRDRQFLIPGAGHYAMLDNYPIFNNLVAEFCSDTIRKTSVEKIAKSNH